MFFAVWLVAVGHWKTRIRFHYGFLERGAATVFVQRDIRLVMQLERLFSQLSSFLKPPPGALLYRFLMILHPVAWQVFLI